MNRDTARRNNRMGVALAALSVAMFGLSFVVAIVYNAS
jgi:hypothetical protein